MQARKEKEKTGREKLAQIIETCRSVEERSLDPFLIDVSENISTTKEYFPEWSIAEDLCLDAETIHHLASVIKLQGEWVKHRSTSLYTDPFLLEEKLRSLPTEEILETYAQAWHPIIELEQISIYSLAQATAYWINLLPLSERWKEKPPAEVQACAISREELVKEKILQDKAFSEELDNFWHELKTCIEEKGQNSKISYWSFIGRETYEETVQRAFMTSFLVTYGYATLEIHLLEENIFIRPNPEQETKIREKQLMSVPISISVEEWKEWKKGNLQ